jgi:hypothetical protein
LLLTLLTFLGFGLLSLCWHDVAVAVAANYLRFAHAAPRKKIEVVAAGSDVAGSIVNSQLRVDKSELGGKGVPTGTIKNGLIARLCHRKLVASCDYSIQIVISVRLQFSL